MVDHYIALLRLVNVFVSNFYDFLICLTQGCGHTRMPGRNSTLSTELLPELLEELLDPYTRHPQHIVLNYSLTYNIPGSILLRESGSAPVAHTPVTSAVNALHTGMDVTEQVRGCE